MKASLSKRSLSGFVNAVISCSQVFVLAHMTCSAYVSRPPFLIHADERAKKPLLGPFLCFKSCVIIKVPKIGGALRVLTR